MSRLLFKLRNQLVFFVWRLNDYNTLPRSDGCVYLSLLPIILRSCPSYNVLHFVADKGLPIGSLTQVLVQLRGYFHLTRDLKSFQWSFIGRSPINGSILTGDLTLEIE
ncbi:hypothetical protein HAX54_002491 [Datura stramonium]|uniref:Uncharacterized protein n=1 Tax=Datura stramonium TaxID=4076 RepID=A0ABS8WRA8_DATST|nr:hypothetical protein [Datura stramonium]